MNESNTKNSTNWPQFLPLISIFFFWGFVAANNDILIPVFKKSFDLSQLQSMLVQWAFYAAYFVGSLIFFLASLKQDLLQKLGYKQTLAYGLGLSAVGAFLFIPAASAGSFWLFLIALFTVGLGFSVQQIVANPLAIRMGSPATGTHRLTMAGAVNSLGTTIGPIILSLAIFGSQSHETALNLHDVKLPFGLLGVAFLLVAVLLLRSKIENPDSDQNSSTVSEKFSLKKYPQLYLGMLAIFIYVGVEVTIASNLPALLKTPEFGNIAENAIAPFISLYWGSLMIGRWNGGLNVFNFNKTADVAMKILVPFLAFGVIILANTLSGKDVSGFYIYPFWIAIFLILSFLGGKSGPRTLWIFGVAGAVMMVLGLIIPQPHIAQYFLISGGLFCSIMWPAIYDIALRGLGIHTGKASSFLVMMILGGGVIPLVQAAIIDMDKGHHTIWGISYTHFSYIVPALGFLYLAWYGWAGYKNVWKNIDDDVL